jgi:hypothetical protein
MLLGNGEGSFRSLDPARYSSPISWQLGTPGYSFQGVSAMALVVIPETSEDCTIPITIMLDISLAAISSAMGPAGYCVFPHMSGDIIRTRCRDTQSASPLR